MTYRIFNSSRNHNRTNRTSRPSDSSDSTSEVKLDSQSEDIGKGAHESSDTQRILLGALRNLIVPLVQNAVPDAKDLESGPEAELLLVALQNYVARIIGNRDPVETHISKPHIKIAHLDVLVSPGVKATQGSVDQVGGQQEPMETSLVSAHKLINTGKGELKPILERLQEQIYNHLPIRLLYFEKNERSNFLKISLLNRTEVYTTLAGTLVERCMRMASDDQERWKLVYEITQYAILSHTWLCSTPSAELSYDDWRDGVFDLTHPGYQKLVQFCRAAKENHGMALGWMDTVCIDKSSSSELDESIRSMYKWYKHSSTCITYLASTTSLDDMSSDPWFTRGWTLQELLAPRNIKFYCRDWNMLTGDLNNDKEHDGILEQIRVATSITREELLADMLSHFPISRRMQWAAKRKVTRGEDIAYSLMGIFDISMSIAYGEGADIAFARLVKEIISTTKYRVLDIFNWGGTYATKFSLLIPSSPAAYLLRDENIDILPARPMEPLTLTHLGLRIPVLIFPSTLTDTPATEYTSKGDFFATVSTKLTEDAVLHRTLTFLTLDINAFDPAITREQRRYAFMVLNCAGDGQTISVPVQCFAIAFSYFNDNVFMTPLTIKQKAYSLRPASFQIRNDTMTPIQNEALQKPAYCFKPNELERHGIQCLTLYC